MSFPKHDDLSVPWSTWSAVGNLTSRAAEQRSAPRKKRKKTDNPREGWEDGTPPPHRDFKERCVMRYSLLRALRKKTGSRGTPPFLSLSTHPTHPTPWFLSFGRHPRSAGI